MATEDLSIHAAACFAREAGATQRDPTIDVRCSRLAKCHSQVGTGSL